LPRSLRTRETLHLLLGAASLYGLVGIGIDSYIANSADVLAHGGGATTR